MYEATLWAGYLNSLETGNNTVFLTLLGFGVFGNDINWVGESIGKAIARVSHYGADIKIKIGYHNDTNKMNIYKQLQTIIDSMYGTEKTLEKKIQIAPETDFSNINCIDYALGNKDESYQNKYLKYKHKYLQLKKLL